LDLIFRLLLTLILGALGGYAAFKLKVPAGFMIGSLIVVMTVNLTTGYLYFPTILRRCTQVLAGTMVGSQVTRDDIRRMRHLIIPALCLMVYFCVFMVLGAVIMWRVSGVDLVTAMFGCAPGGMSDMGLISADYGANTALVTPMQMIRLVSVLLSYPFIFKSLGKRGLIHPETSIGTSMVSVDAAMAASTEKPPVSPPLPDLKTIKDSALLIGVATVAGVLLYSTGFTSGLIVGGMFGAAAVNIASGGLHFESRIRRFIQICSGAYIGTIISRSDLAMMSVSYIPIIILILNVLILPLVFGYLIHKLTKLELSTALFGATPGGLQEMSVLASEMGLDTPRISIIHTSRVVVSLALFPTIISLVTHFFDL